MSTFVLPQTSYVINTLLVTLAFMLVNLPCTSVWVIFATAIAKFLTHPKARMTFNFILVALLIGIVFLLFR
jgi:threonine/homoserine/homoserine lactone efflux protein